MAVLPHAQIKPLLDRSRGIRDAFWWLMSVENAGSAEWSVNLARRSAEARMAHLL